MAMLNDSRLHASNPPSSSPSTMNLVKSPTGSRQTTCCASRHSIQVCKYQYGPIGCSKSLSSSINGVSSARCSRMGSRRAMTTYPASMHRYGINTHNNLRDSFFQSLPGWERKPEMSMKPGMWNV